MRLPVVIATCLAALAAACGSGEGSAAAEPVARLTITVWPRGEAAGEAKQWSLRCRPTGGTLPRRLRACEQLLSLDAPFRPVPRDMACAELYGGGQEALVTGRFRSRPVNARFRRSNGCEIERWNRVALLFPVAVGVGAA